jgi:hypothetical protein
LLFVASHLSSRFWPNPPWLHRVFSGNFVIPAPLAAQRYRSPLSRWTERCTVQSGMRQHGPPVPLDFVFFATVKGLTSLKAEKGQHQQKRQKRAEAGRGFPWPQNSQCQLREGGKCFPATWLSQVRRVTSALVSLRHSAAWTREARRTALLFPRRRRVRASAAGCSASPSPREPGAAVAQRQLLADKHGPRTSWSAPRSAGAMGK